MEIKRVANEDVDLYRTIRLAALAADPGAFGSSIERERQFSAEDWAARIAGFRGQPGAIFVAMSHDEPVGVVGIGRAEGTSDGHLWGMWVEPSQRGQGVGSDLIDAATQWARAHKLDSIRLEVTADNDRAVSLYQSAGFVKTRTPPASPECELEMVLAL